MLILKMVNQLVTNQIWTPRTMADDYAERSDVVCERDPKPEFLGASGRRTKHRARYRV